MPFCLKNIHKLTLSIENNANTTVIRAATPAVLKMYFLEKYAYIYENIFSVTLTENARVPKVSHR